MGYELEEMDPRHVVGVTAIFNHWSTTSFAAYPEAEVSPELVGRMLMAPGHACVVALQPEGRVVGFGLLRPWNPLPTFRRTGEVSYFLAPEHVGKGLGTALLEWLEARAARQGVRTLLAGISSRNPESLAFHARRGFTERGRFLAVGEKHGRAFDVVWMQKTLADEVPGADRGDA